MTGAKLTRAAMVFTLLLPIVAASQGAPADYQKCAPWPKWEANSQNTGVALGYGSTNPKIRQTFQTLQPGPVSIAENGTAYFGATSYTASGYVGTLVALPMKPGAYSWTYENPDRAGFWVEPALGANSMVYAGSQDGKLFAFDSATGTVEWTFPTGGPINSCPAIGSDGTVYFGSADGYVYAVDGSNGGQVWSFKTGKPIASSPALNSGVLYVGSEDANLYALDEKTGAKDWNFLTGGAIYFSPAIGAYGTVYIGSDDHVLYAIDGTTAQQKWTFTAPSTVRASAGIAQNGWIYFGSLRSIFALDGTTGEERWTFATQSLVSGPPTIDSHGTVYAGSHDNNVYALDGTTGSKQFQIPGNPNSPPIGPDGSLYVEYEYYFYQYWGEFNFDLNEQTVAGGSTALGIITLPAAAGAGGTTFNVSSDNPDVSVPATVTVPQGQTGVSFSIPTPTVGSIATATIRVECNGDYSQETLTIQAPFTKFYVSPTAIYGWGSTTGVVQFAKPAPVGGYQVSLQSSSSDFPVPAPVTVPAGSSGASFKLTAGEPASQENVTLTATVGSASLQTNVIVTPFAFHLSSTTITCGASTAGVVTMGGPALTPGTVYAESSSGDVTIPATVPVPLNKAGVSFAVKASSPVSNTENVTITATMGTWSEQATLSVQPYPLSKIYTTPSAIIGGQSTYCVVQIAGAAGPSGNVIQLTSDSVLQVPTQVTIPAGKTGVSLLVRSSLVPSIFYPRITANFGSQKIFCSVELEPPPIANFYVSPSEVTSGMPSHGVVQIAQKVASGAIQVSLSSQSPYAQVPSSVTIPAGSTGVSFEIKTTAGMDGYATLHATTGFVDKQTRLYFLPAISNLYATPSTLVGGNTTQLTVVLAGSAVAPGGDVVTLSSSNPSLVTAPASVTLTSGTTTSVQLTTSAVTAQTQVTIMATLGSSIKTTVVTLTP